MTEEEGEKVEAKKEDSESKEDDGAKAAIRAAFSAGDKDGDGALSRAELGRLLEGKEHWDKARIDRVFEGADVNGDGAVCLKELEKALDKDDLRTVFGMHLVPGLEKTPWGATVAVPERYLKKPATVPETEKRAMTLQQLVDFGELAERIVTEVEILDAFLNDGSRITWATANLYILCSLMVMPLTRVHKCSFVELVASGPQLPNWFISHWWGTPFRDTLRMLQLHTKVRGLLASTACYWMCTFANNQHDLAELAVHDLLLTPFVKALMSPTCTGTIALMTEVTAMPLERIWCVLEDYISLVKGREKESGHLFDVATMIPERTQHRRDNSWSPRCAALLNDKGNGDFGTGYTDDPDQLAWFPGDVSMLAVDVDLAEAKATNPSDKNNILRLISSSNNGAQEDTGGGGPDAVNRCVRRLFAPLAWYNLSTSGRFVDSSKLEYLLNRDFGDNQAEGCRLLDKHGCLADACTGAYSKSSSFLNCIKVLLKFRADPNAPSTAGNLPLSFAASYNFHGALKALLASRADPLAKKQKLEAGQRSTPLHSKESGDDKADMFRKDGIASPLHFANFYGDGETWNILTEHGYSAHLKCGWYGPDSSPNEPDSQGFLPLSIACQYNIHVRLKALLEAKADPLKAEKEEKGKIVASPLHYANKHGNGETWNILTEHGYSAHLKCGWYGPDSSPNEPDSQGHLPLSIACQYNIHVRLKALLEAKADPLKAEKEEKGKIAASPLHYANKHGNGETWNILTEHGYSAHLKYGWYGPDSSPNEPDSQGHLPLSIACQYNIHVRLKALLEAKADPLKAEKEEKGKIVASPLHYANKHGDQETWDILRLHGYGAHLKEGWHGAEGS